MVPKHAKNSNILPKYVYNQNSVTALLHFISMNCDKENLQLLCCCCFFDRFGAETHRFLGIFTLKKLNLLGGKLNILIMLCVSFIVL